jgi:hypothetical protein
MLRALRLASYFLGAALAVLIYTYVIVAHAGPRIDDHYCQQLSSQTGQDYQLCISE